MTMDLATVMQRLYDSEINCCVSSFWDGGWTVKLGDEMNGYIAEGYGDTLSDCAEFLDREARRLMPDSVYAGGKGYSLPMLN